VTVLKCVLWDFGDTLVDERWMLAPLDGVPAWPEVWSRVARGELADAWNAGAIDTAEVVDAVAAALGVGADVVHAHVQRCCAHIAFFETPWRVARTSRLPQAIITVNPDAFSKVIVPRYELARIFDPIVTSWEERTLDKCELALAALARLDGDVLPAEALLIDNLAHNVDAWIARGGRGYWFRGDDPFRADLDGALAELAATLR
jgi:beta-phosphoglucomutase-like phosphatase (HAD superfamily)